MPPAGVNHPARHFHSRTGKPGDRRAPLRPEGDMSGLIPVRFKFPRRRQSGGQGGVSDGKDNSIAVC